MMMTAVSFLIYWWYKYLKFLFHGAATPTHVTRVHARLIYGFINIYARTAYATPALSPHCHYWYLIAYGYLHIIDAAEAILAYIFFGRTLPFLFSLLIFIGFHMDTYIRFREFISQFIITFGDEMLLFYILRAITLRLAPMGPFYIISLLLLGQLW